MGFSYGLSWNKADLWARWWIDRVDFYEIVRTGTTTLSGDWPNESRWSMTTGHEFKNQTFQIECWTFESWGTTVEHFKERTDILFKKIVQKLPEVEHRNFICSKKYKSTYGIWHTGKAYRVSKCRYKSTIKDNTNWYRTQFYPQRRIRLSYSA